jgi:LPXTG-site transpeptidase (sortase) family protein
MKMKRLLLIISTTLILAGLTGIFGIFYYNHRGSAMPVTGVQTHTVQAKPETISGTPVKLSIPSLDMKLVVAPGKYNKKTGEWTLSRDKAHFAELSIPPNNQEGNTFIYGHHRPEVFTSLKKVKQGDKAIITTDNGYRFTYVFESHDTVWPTDTSIFAYSGPPQLTIQTCTGVFMQDRQLFYFKFVSFEKIEKS